MSNKDNIYNDISKEFIIDKIYSKESLKDEYSEDMRFLNKIKAHMTISGQLPFQVPIDNIPLIIEQCSEWYFRHCEDASEELWYLVDTSKLRRNGHFNLEYRMPPRIISVNEIHGVNGAVTLGAMPYSYNLAFRYETMFMTASAWSNMNVGGYAMNSINKMYTNRFYDHIGDSMLAIFSQGDINSIFSKKYRHKYNRNNRMLRFLSNVDASNIVLSVRQRLHLQDLYDDDRFVRYVVGHCLEAIDFIIDTFEFKMPGNIKINPAKYKERGAKLIEEVRKEIEDDDDSPIIMFS